jgi:hypothetical protein
MEDGERSTALLIVPMMPSRAPAACLPAVGGVALKSPNRELASKTERRHALFPVLGRRLAPNPITAALFHLAQNNYALIY